MSYLVIVTRIVNPVVFNFFSPLTYPRLIMQNNPKSVQCNLVYITGYISTAYSQETKYAHFVSEKTIVLLPITCKSI